MRRKVSVDKINNPKETIKRIWQYLKKYKVKMFFLVLAIILYVAFNALTTLILSPIIDDYIIPMIKEANASIYISGLIKQIIYLMVFTILTALMSYLEYKIVVNISQLAIRDMRKDLFHKLNILPIKYYDNNPHGKLMSSITNDLDNVMMALDNCIDRILMAILTIIVNFIVMLKISPKLTLISIISIPIYLIVSIFIMKLTKKQFTKQQESLSNLNAFIEEYISGEKVIKSFNKEKDTLNKFDKYNEDFKKTGFKAQAYGSIVMPIMSSLNSIVMVITYVFSGIMAIKGKISIGNITVFTKYARQFGQPINEIAQEATFLQSGLAGAERVFAIIDEEREFKDDLDKPDLKDVKGAIEFKNVSFGYDEDKLILKNINLKAKPGETIAIVGPTGAGKTTIINLLARFYDINQGEILIDGTNIKDVNIYSLRNTLGIVLQDTVLFSDTVSENIKFGKLDATKKEIVEAAKLANADSFINRLPEKYETILNEDTTNISVGQKQLLNIARVILNDPKILILDEATSNVDTRTEVKIQEAMNHLVKDRTSFIIAHRLSTIRNADKIIVINDGQIKEIGSHKELINKKGIYYKMYTGMFDENNNYGGIDE